VWVGHILMDMSRLEDSERFIKSIGMRSTARGNDFAVLKLRGGTHLVLRVKDHETRGEASCDLMVDDIDKFIEGQGSLLRIRSSAPLALMRGACPTHLILCHRAGMVTLDELPSVAVPPLREVIALNETLVSAAGAYARPVTTGIALKTDRLSDEEARCAIAEVEDETGLPATDVVRYGPEKLGRELL